jgi:hypothetical protein
VQTEPAFFVYYIRLVNSCMPSQTRTYREGSEIIEITSPGDPYHLDEREIVQHRCIVENWESFAAAAYEGFRRFGIGAVIVEEDALSENQVRHPFLRHKIWYATSFEAWVKQGYEVGAGSWLEEQIQAYDPQSACMFIFLREDGHPRIYLVESTLKPAAALSRIKAFLN